jgi:hypothetical protein
MKIATGEKEHESLPAHSRGRFDVSRDRKGWYD